MPSNRYLPSGPVVVLPTSVPSSFCRVTVTPGTPGSPASCNPSLFRSFQTKSPTLLGGPADTPASTVLSTDPGPPSSTLAVPVAGSTLESAVRLGPASLAVQLNCEAAGAPG